MNGYDFTLAGESLTALPSGALWHRGLGTLCVSDLHLGKSGRIARRLGLMLPPFDTAETLSRLAADIDRMRPARVVCLGDSFDDLQAAGDLEDSARATLAGLQAGRDWIWIEGNHDAGPVELGGSHRATLRLGALTLRHIADPAAGAEVSGHYHPKLALPGAGAARPCLVVDASRAILPAYGAYTGGMSATRPELRRLFAPRAIAVLTGRQALAVPLPPERRPDTPLPARP